MYYFILLVVLTVLFTLVLLPALTVLFTLVLLPVLTVLFTMVVLTVLTYIPHLCTAHSAGSPRNLSAANYAASTFPLSVAYRTDSTIHLCIAFPCWQSRFCLPCSQWRYCVQCWHSWYSLHGKNCQKQLLNNSTRMSLKEKMTERWLTCFQPSVLSTGFVDAASHFHKAVSKIRSLWMGWEWSNVQKPNSFFPHIRISETSESKHGNVDHYIRR